MRSPDHRGFTLIELMIVIVVMGIVMAMVVPSTAKFAASHRFAGTRNTFMQDMRLARSLASSQRRAYELRRSISGYSLVRLSPDSTVLSRTMPRDVSFAAVDSTTFYAWGLTEPATIVLRQGSRTSVVRATSGGQVSHD